MFRTMILNPSLDEQAAASMVAALSGKRVRDGADDAAGGYHPEKMARISPSDVMPVPVPPLPELPAMMAAPAAAHVEAGVGSNHLSKLQPAPFYFYNDFSRDVDPDPLTPLTPPGRVPNFPAKMHAILSRPDLADVIAWMPHGRSWRVLKPREFEVRVLPTFFEHSKFSSFIRQANGWGFRRITQGRDRNSYYHELFLRGLPHLCKQMKRPGVAEKRAADSEHEPDLYTISESFPVPEKADDDSIMLECTVQGGPKARMPIYTGAILSAESLRLIHGGSDANLSTSVYGTTLTPKDHTSLTSFHRAISASDNQICMNNPQEQTLPVAPSQPSFFVPQNSFINGAIPMTATMSYNNHVNALSTGANNMAFTMSIQPHLAFQASTPDSANMSFQASSAASQFAAGFAAATALSSTHIRNVLGQALAANQNFQQLQQSSPPAILQTNNDLL